MSSVEDIPTNAGATTTSTSSVPPPGRGRVYHMVHGFAADGDEFVVTATGETLTFPQPPKRPDPAGIYYSAATRDRQDHHRPLLDSSPNSRGANGEGVSGPTAAIGGRSVGSAVTAVGSGVCVAALSAYALKHHQSRRIKAPAATADTKAAAGRAEECDRHADEPVEPVVRRPDPSEAPNARTVSTSCQKNVAPPSVPAVVYVTESRPEDDEDPSISSPLGSVEKGAVQDDEEACPELAEEELDVTAMSRTAKNPAARHSGNGSSALALHASASPFSSAVVRMDSREGVSDFADRLCEVSSALQATMASKGIRLDEKTTLKLAVRRLEKQDQQDFEIAKEMRRYMFEHGERDVDRKQKDRHHQECVEVHREAKGWLAEVAAARSMCESQIINGVMWCGVAVVCLPVAYRFVVYVRFVYEGGIRGFAKATLDAVRCFCGSSTIGIHRLPHWNSPTNLCSCPLMLQIFSTCYSSPVAPRETSLFSSLMGPVVYYMPSLPTSDAVACCVVRGSAVIVGSAILFGLSRFSARANAVVLVCGAVFQSVRVSAFYVTSQQIPLIGLLTALVLGLAYVRWTHRKCTMSLKKGDGRSPSIAEVSEALSRFDELSHWIAILTPSLGLSMLCIVAMLWR